MPDNEKESKIMSMLERKGIIRRTEGDSSEASSADNAGIPDPDIKPMFDYSEEHATIKTAPRQPVPGMSTPIFPSDEAVDISKEEPKFTSTPAPKAASEYTAPISESTSEVPAASSYTEPPAPVAYTEPPKQTSSFGGLNIFRNGSAPSETVVAEPVSGSSEPQPENYTSRYLNVNELYDALALRAKKTDTIYLIEEYLQTLPGSLPDSQRREIVAKLLAASGFDFDLLMGDGVLRVKMLKEYAERFARHTDDYIAARQAELEELDQQMLRTRRLIENRKELHKKQFYTIEAEAQRLKEILTFISG